MSGIEDMDYHAGNEQGPTKPFEAGYGIIGSIMGFFFSLLGLIPLCCISTSSSKKSFLIGWTIGFVIQLILGVILFFTIGRRVKLIAIRK